MLRSAAPRRAHSHASRLQLRGIGARTADWERWPGLTRLCGVLARRLNGDANARSVTADFMGRNRVRLNHVLEAAPVHGATAVRFNEAAGFPHPQSSRMWMASHLIDESRSGRQLGSGDVEIE